MGSQPQSGGHLAITTSKSRFNPWIAVVPSFARRQARWRRQGLRSTPQVEGVKVACPAGHASTNGQLPYVTCEALGVVQPDGMRGDGHCRRRADIRRRPAVSCNAPSR